MAFLDANKSEVQLFLTYVNLPKMTYTDNTNASRNGESKAENIVAPLFHFVTPAYHDNWRFGFSVAVPGGLAKRWDTAYQAAAAKKFSLRIIEANPTAAYKVNDYLSFGFGARAVYSTGEVTSDNPAGTPPTAMDMEGDSFDFGYNLALSVRPTDELKLAATYRSKVNLSIEGNAKLTYGSWRYDDDASVKVPLPAVLSLAAAYTFFQKTTAEFVYERVYWSAFKQIDFNFPEEGGTSPTGTILSGFGAPKDKNWRDSNTYRLGVTHRATDNLKLMAGFAIDRTPAPKKYLAFELPDADSRNYAAGFEYKVNDDINIGMAYLFSDKKEREIGSSNKYGVDGKFTDGGAHLVNMSFKYRF
jgi:long-chain fatty acid transport protein